MTKSPVSAPHAQQERPKQDWSKQAWPTMNEMDFGRMFTAGAPSIKAFAAAQGHMIDRMATMNREIAGFVEKRLDQDRAVVQELACCTSPQEAMAIWGKFAETASKHYVQEMSKIASLAADQARETVEDVRHEIEQAATLGNDSKSP